VPPLGASWTFDAASGEVVLSESDGAAPHTWLVVP
jgi:hypothetical protein